jgi:putative ABC transport system permease protein
MILHFLVAALANIRKAPFTSAANILTLALGLACFVAAYGLSAFLTSGDRQHPGADRLVYVCMGCDTRREEVASPVRLARDLREDMPELEAVGRIFPTGLMTGGGQAVSSGESKAFLSAVSADPEIFDLFAFEFVEGAPGAALRAPEDVVLLEETARRLFGREPALGKTVRVDGAWDATVSGVVAPIRGPSLLNGAGGPLRYEMITNLSGEVGRMISRVGAPADVAEGWHFNGAITIARMPPSMSIETFQARLDDFAERRLEKRPDGRPIYRFSPVPLQAIVADFVNGALGLPLGGVLMGLGGLILLVACVNYANLAAAQTEGRVKESGMRKVLGAGRLALAGQHVVESGVQVVPALALAVIGVALASQFLRNLGLDLTYFLTAGPRGALFLIGLSVVTAAAAALYPALRVARVRAVDALGSGAARAGSGWIARVLVGVQFLTVSFLLIVMTAILGQQAYVRDVVFDPEEDPVVVLGDASNVGVAFETLAAELRDLPQVASVTSTNAAPWSGQSFSWMVGLSGDVGAAGRRIRAESAGPEFFETYDLGIVAGRSFDPVRDRPGTAAFDFESDPAEPVPIVIDRRLAESLGLDPEAAIGRTLYRTPNTEDASARPGPAVGVVVGVVETIHSRLTDAGYGGVALAFDPAYERARFPAVRIDRSDIPGALAGIERVWDSLAPDIPVRIRFAEDLFDASFAPYRAVAWGLVVVAGGALLISTSGLMGIAVFVAARRRREMGVRKVLGASVFSLARMLIVDFSKPILVANLLAWPLGYLVAQAFLSMFEERMPITPATFLASTALTLLIAWAAVMGEVWKAASIRPAEVLRHA